MPEHAYEVVELVGPSRASADGAVRTAIARASATPRHLRRFGVVQARGAIGGGSGGEHFQVTLKAASRSRRGRPARAGGARAGAAPRPRRGRAEGPRPDVRSITMPVCSTIARRRAHLPRATVPPVHRGAARGTDAPSAEDLIRPAVMSDSFGVPAPPRR
jgi:dodecin